MHRMHMISVAWVAWATIVAGGVASLIAYDFRAGDSDPTPQSWPITEEGIESTSGRIVMFVHPHCACSRASLSELKRVVDDSQGELTVSVMFVRPAGVSAEWHLSDLWEQAGEIPGIERNIDEGGEMARRFGAKTSGHCFVYGASGELQFSGGLTLARGHVGRSKLTARATLNELQGRPSGACCSESAPVFGCPLLNEINVN